MSSIGLKFKHGQYKNHKTTFMMKNGEIVLKELIASSNGKYNPFRIFSAKELTTATDNYDKQKVIIHRDSYKLYQGFWQERQISVMKFENQSKYDQCINNVVYPSQMSNKHIIKLIGCCLETEIPILVFEYVLCATLADRLRNPVQSPFGPLLLTHRLKIAMDIGNALAYLHVGFPRPILFRDVKLANILFNEENVAKLFDFSLSISIPEGETYISTAVTGTIGFIAPEYLISGICNEKCDVFSFGIFLLELLTAQRAFDLGRLANDEDAMLLDYVKTYVNNDRVAEIVDPIIVENRSYPGNEQQLLDFVRLILECTNRSPGDRPTMIEAAKKLRKMYISVVQSSNFMA